MNNKCHDCGVKEGKLHLPGCDMETCPFCFGQLLSCDCCYKELKIDCSPSTWCYSHGLTIKQQKRWLKLLNKKGRIPWILYPYFCSRCGESSSEFFMVSNKEWEKYIETDHREDIICKSCYKIIKGLIDKYGKNTIKKKCK